MSPAVEVAGYCDPLVRCRAFDRSRTGSAGDLGRSRPTQPGADQSPGQCRAGAARLGGRQARITISTAAATAKTARSSSVIADTGPGYPEGHPAAHLRAVLHHQGGRGGHRHRLVVLPPHRPVAWRDDRGRKPPRRGGSALSSRCPLPAAPTSRRRRRSERGAGACIASMGWPAWSWTTKRRSATSSPRCSMRDGFKVTSPVPARRL